MSKLSLKPQTKISKAQYKALLQRSMDRQPVEDQQSQALNLQQMTGGMTQGPMASPMMPQGMLGASSPLGALAAQPQPQMPAAELPMPGSTPLPPQTADATSVEGNPAAPTTELMAQAAQAWREIGNTLGGRLWARLSRSNRPEEAFMQAATQYLRNPNSVVDERVKQFLASIFPPGSGPSIQAPQGLDQMSGEGDPLTQLILSTMR